MINERKLRKILLQKKRENQTEEKSVTQIVGRPSKNIVYAKTKN